MGNSASGPLAVRVFQAPRVVHYLCRNACGLAYPRCGRSFRPVPLCLAKVEPVYCPSQYCDRVHEVKPYSAKVLISLLD